MIIKKPDDKSADLEALRALAARPDVSADTRRLIEREIRNIQSGMKGEAEAAYEIEFHYGASKNWMIIHDLRLECEGRVAQIDHLLINRLLEIYVCESKRFSEGVAINEHGEFSAFFGGKAYGVPSPLEQNRRHIAVLEAVFRSDMVALPTRLGINIKPSLQGLVLVSKTARISRPSAKIDGVESVIKNDQLNARIERNIREDNNLLNLAKVVSQDTAATFARALAGAHKPISFDWAAKFGLSAEAPTYQTSAPAAASPAEQVSPKESAGVESDAEGRKKAALVCVTCGVTVGYNVAKFCWFNKPRFGGKIFCMDCQKAVPAPAR